MSTRTTGNAWSTALRGMGALAVALGCVAAPAAAAGEFLSIAEDGVLMYDAPSVRAKRLFVATRGYPVEVVVNIDQWARVRDVAGDLVWVEKKSLASRRTVLVSAETAEIRREPSDTAPVVFRARRGVMLDLVEPGSTGWARVRHADGSGGFVRTAQVWGL